MFKKFWSAKILLYSLKSKACDFFYVFGAVGPGYLWLGTLARL